MKPIRIIAQSAAAFAVTLGLTAAGTEDPFARTASFCNAGKAFGLKLGSKQAEGQHLSVTSSLVELPPAYRPFSSAEVVVTLHQRRTHTVHGEADFESDFDATEARIQIRGALLASGWLAESSGDGASGELLYSDRAATDPAKPKGMVADLFTLGSRLYFTCSDAALAHQARLELTLRPPTPLR